VKSVDARNPTASPVSFAGARVNLGGTAGGGAPNPQGLTGQPNVFVNPAPGPLYGQVYLMASLLPAAGSGLQAPDPMDVRIVRSIGEDGGWLAPVRVNDDVITPWRNWQWMAEGAVAPNGRIDAIWFDTRNSGVANISQLFYAYSWDGGATWSPNVAVTPSFDSTIGYPQQNKMGDYITLVSDATGAHVAYAATFNGEQDVYYARLFPDCNGNGVSDIADLASPEIFDCNANHVPDGCEAAPVCLGAGAVSGALTLGKGGGGDLLLQWSGSCADDDDYAVYEGTLGSFDSHVAVSCTTGGALARSLTPAVGNTYYLVVPTHADREGSYGQDSSGTERPPGAGACLPQQVASCGS
jgi:hypothetical protein